MRRIGLIRQGSSGLQLTLFRGGMMARDHGQLEHFPDGFIAFHTKDGQRWRLRDVEASRVGPGYRVFISDAGEERRYEFGPKEPHDATLLDLREQLAKARPMGAGTGGTTGGTTGTGAG